MVKQTEDYRTLSARLDEVLAALQAPNVTIDEAVKHYQEGSELVARLQQYLDTAENRITKLKSQSS